MNRARVLPCILLACAAVAAGQMEAPHWSAMVPGGVDVRTTIRKDVDEVRLVFTAMGRHGRFVQGLGPQDVQVFDDNRAVPRYTYFQGETDLPLRIAVLVDVSGSMKEQLGFEGKFTEKFLHGIVRPEDSAMIVGFNTRTSPIDSTAAAAGLKALHRHDPLAGTAIYDALAAAFPLLGAGDMSSARKVVVLITDGDDNASRHSLRSVIDEALRHEVGVYVISTAGAFIPRNLKQLAAETGGWVWHAASVRAMVKAFARISTALRSQYVLAYRPDAAQLDGRYHPLRVHTKSADVHCRTGYFARQKTPRELAP